jgi:hypothetical protein
VGSMLYFASEFRLHKNGFGTQGDREISTGPTIKEGQMIDWSFSRWSVSNLPEREEWSESTEEMDDVTLRGGRPGDTGREDAAIDLLNRAGLGCSSDGVERGDDNAGDWATTSSVSDAGPLPSDAAKLLDISGSDINA